MKFVVGEDVFIDPCARNDFLCIS